MTRLRSTRHEHTTLSFSRATAQPRRSAQTQPPARPKAGALGLSSIIEKPLRTRSVEAGKPSRRVWRSMPPFFATPPSVHSVSNPANDRNRRLWLTFFDRPARAALPPNSLRNLTAEDMARILPRRWSQKIPSEGSLMRHRWKAVTLDKKRFSSSPRGPPTMDQNELSGAVARYGFTIFFGSTTRSNSASVTKPSLKAAVFNVRSLSMA
jgi:hypothetical protein